MNEGDWNDAGASVLGMQLRTADDEVLVWFNRRAEAGDRASCREGDWAVGSSSDDKAPVAFTGSIVHLPPRSVVALVRAQIPRTSRSRFRRRRNRRLRPSSRQIRRSNPNEQPPAPVEEPPPASYPDETATAARRH